MEMAFRLESPVTPQALPRKIGLKIWRSWCFAQRSVVAQVWRRSSFRGDHFLIRDTAWEGKLLQDQAKVGERRVFIPPATRAAVLRWLAVYGDAPPDGLLFPSDKGTPISAHNFRNRVLVPLREKLRLSVPLTFQVLRRSHATRNQATPKDAQAHLGHKSIVTTMDVYSVEIPDSVRQMVTRDEEKVLGNSPGNSLIAPKLRPTRKPQ
jgi:integrase